jgi:hypothetical protein
MNNLTTGLLSKRIIFLFAILFFLQLNSSAQEDRIYIGSGLSTIMIKTSGHYKQNTSYDSFWNMDSDFKYGVLTLINDSVIDNMGVRYNVTRDRFEAISDTAEGIYIVSPDNVKKITRMSETFIFSKYTNSKGVLAKGYFKVIYDGDTKLYYRKAEIHKEGKHGAFGYNPYKTFDTNYYIKKSGDQYPSMVKKKKKDILKALDYKGPKLEVFAKEYGLRFTNTNDLIEIFTYYDHLMKEKQ